MTIVCAARYIAAPTVRLRARAAHGRFVRGETSTCRQTDFAERRVARSEKYIDD